MKARDLPMVSAVRWNILTVAAGHGLLEWLAEALIRGRCGGAEWSRSGWLPAQVRVFLPTKRSCGILRATLMRRMGGEVSFLPRLYALGDLDDGEAGEDDIDGIESRCAWERSLSIQERRIILTRMVLHWYGSRGMSGTMTAVQAMRLADKLGILMDALESHEASPRKLADFVPGEHARYWEDTRDFLGIVTEMWPRFLKEKGCVSRIAQRNGILNDMVRRFQDTPDTKEPVIIAGSTGFSPATARLMGRVAQLPRGAVILPGLDMSLDAAAWKRLATDERTAPHPQHGLASLLEGWGVSRDVVRVVGEENAVPASRQREQLVSVAMRPVLWNVDRGAGGIERSSGKEDVGLTSSVYEGLTYIEADDMAEEALVIAAMFRECAGTPGRKMSLVTPDRTLARSVMAELARWGIVPEDSRGSALEGTAAGLFVESSARLLGESYGWRRSDTPIRRPMVIFDILKQDLCGLAQGDMQAVYDCERWFFREGRKEGGEDGGKEQPPACWRDIVGAAGRRDDESPRVAAARVLLERLRVCLETCWQSLGGVEEVSFQRLLSVHRELALALLGEDQVQRMSDWEDFAGDLGMMWQAMGRPGLDPDMDFTLPVAEYPAVLAAYLSGMTSRVRRVTHPDLSILGLLEARLIRADRVVLGGLNEGVWPAQADSDPWLNRAMRHIVGLPPAERKRGLSAHDFAQAFVTRCVVVTRARETEGVRSVCSPWLLRMDAALKRHGLEQGLAPGDAETWRRRARILRRGREPTVSVTRPCPCPPVSARPRKLSVSQVGDLIGDRYGFYARHILKLSRLESMVPDDRPALRGSVIHAVLARFLKESPDLADRDAAVRVLRDLGRKVMQERVRFPEIRRLWEMGFDRIAERFVDHESGYREGIERSDVEVRGVFKWGGYTLQARADRIDRLKGGRVRIYDYKTGKPPKRKEVESFLHPQLPLEAVVALEGGFEDVGAVQRGEIEALVYVHVSGREDHDWEVPIAGNAKDVEKMVKGTFEALKAELSAFEKPEQGYDAGFRQRFDKGFFGGDYDHLARVQEWVRHHGVE